mmetsp:Transcript_68042/g.107928  ORF Transcript_68042/g.107928 Transcript_68042/m.107928 type:complete len:175 (-) Transcript_68042:91-615(-)|eukprot:CAMPEP_0169115726 /NCGR_PEP_ID=MMETSP1015-20121227/29493_1 /TAXON_ID=342587 /ORGANISM="Karlodinium micrum, Strain CCMP2283" /LENGTH=174 /DNA_ID=CAMNT_0009178191 /DNA_START=97 /DNA_END=621 /DNA_ORIENTATION=+
MFILSTSFQVSLLAPIYFAVFNEAERDAQHQKDSLSLEMVGPFMGVGFRELRDHITGQLMKEADGITQKAVEAEASANTVASNIDAYRSHIQDVARGMTDLETNAKAMHKDYAKLLEGEHWMKISEDSDLDKRADHAARALQELEQNENRDATLEEIETIAKEHAKLLPRDEVD